MPKWFLFALVVAATFVVACSSIEILPGVGPVAQFARLEHWLYVYGNQEASKSDLVNMDVFGRYVPGLPIRVVLDRYGEPQRVIPRESGAQYVEYMEPQGRFRLGEEGSADGDIGHPLYFFPNDRRPAALLPPYIVEKLRPAAEKDTVMLFECGYDQLFIIIVLEGGQVDHVIWSHDDELIRRESPDQCTD